MPCLRTLPELRRLVPAYDPTDLMDDIPHDQDSLEPLRQQLREQREKIGEMHRRGLDANQVCARLATMVDALVLKLFETAASATDSDTADRLRSQVAVVGLGSYGRRQCAPFSDVDLMILHEGWNQEEVARILRPLTQGMFDIGLQLGHSIRTIDEAIGLARHEADVCTSFVDARLLVGRQTLFDSFRTRFETAARKRSKIFCKEFLEARKKERDQYGETVYLLEPHVKRSRGGLRELNLLRWLGFAQHGQSDPERLFLMGAISKFDHRRLLSARGFLLRLRNEMHFHWQSVRDMLDRAEQLRVAEQFGYADGRGMLPVERMMRDYFRHTNHLWQLVLRREASMQTPSAMSRVLDPVLGKTVEQDYRVGVSRVTVSPAGMDQLKKNLREVIRLVQLAAANKKLIDHRVWSALLLSAPDFSDEITSEVTAAFFDLLDEKHVGEALRTLHTLGYLEKIIPPMRHARGLLQFNQYHKYTVDEHCLRAVRKATQFTERKDALGEAYRKVKDKHILHLALLIHDLGKGFEEDHSEVGRRLAGEMGERLKLSDRHTDDLQYLVHQHLTMAHLAFRRDTSDEQLIEQFANEVGSVGRLRMLFVLTCADLAAVGPGVLNDWKVEVLAKLYAQTAQHLKSEGDAPEEDDLAKHRQQVLANLTTDEQTDVWFQEQAAALPAVYLASRTTAAAAETLQRFRALSPSATDVWAEVHEGTSTLEFTAGIDQGLGRGAFSSMAGVLSSERMQILAASTEPLAGGLLMLRYVVSDAEVADSDPQASTSPQRLQKICQAMIDSVDSDKAPQFRQIWGQQQAEASVKLSPLPNKVRIDNEGSEHCTIVEVFTFDRAALLYLLARKLHDLQLIIRHAKISTHLDQAVDVFYLTDRTGGKITDESRLMQIREELLGIIGTE